ncbi:MAG: hypothetical protein GTO55_02270 [Armatimonadetes bacterium]|nr:hypothetical protein [Armatimonadota bacterium]NIM23104.1 hypothetical protein [Armatimonadota bacterium]NIM66972.1 hypothetical protein [Armatimonadota bacterium]NIM75506.1 hypothetical protein [Armatimonadota bacterium]NIN05161.1 hypothetical protein [Armatimonadota bacterium]
MAKRWRWELPACAIFTLLGFMVGLASATGSIRLISPKSGATLKGSVLVQAAVEAQGVSFVIFGVDGNKSHATNARPYSFLLDTTELSDGPHVIFAEVHGRGGLLCRSTPIKIKVKNGRAVAPAPLVQKPQPEAKTAPVVKLSPEAVSEPGMSALTSRVLEGGTPQEESPPQALSSEPRMASEQVTLPQTETPHPRTVTDTSQLVMPVAEDAVEAPKALVSGGPSVVLNGKALPFDVAPAIRDGRLEAGFRRILSSVGWRVSWLSSQKTGVACFQGHRIEVTLGEEHALVDGQRVALGRKVQIKNGRLIVPVRTLCQVAGMRVNWDQKTHTARLFSPHSLSAKTVAAAPP